MISLSVSQLLESPQLRSLVPPIRAAIFAITLALLTVGAGSLLQGEPAKHVAEAVPHHTEIQPAPDTTIAIEAVTPALVEAAAPAEAAVPPENRRYRKLSEFLAKRYKVSETVTLDLVAIAHSAGQQMGLDPLLIIAVIAVESRFNPIAESVAGAKGLMQVIPKYHTDKFRDFGGVKTVFDPETNILVGSQILKEYLKRTGNLNTALQLYGGVSSDADDAYFGKVMSEKQRLQQLLRNSPSRPEVEASITGERIALATSR